MSSREYYNQVLMDNQTMHVIAGDISDTLPKLDSVHDSKIWIENRKYGFVEIIFRKNFARVLFHASSKANAHPYKVFTKTRYSNKLSNLSDRSKINFDDSVDSLLETRETNDVVRFAVFGDWGHGGNDLKSTAKLLKTYDDRIGLDAVLLLGDSFYPEGISEELGVMDPSFHLFTDILAGDIDNLKFYTVLGNHDVLGSVPAQIAYHKIDSRWVFPARYYHKTFMSGVKVCVWFLDTNDMHAEQLSWLELSLADSNCDWMFVAGHHPMYSAGEYSNSSTLRRLREKLIPLFHKYGVDIYFSGHEHQSQILKDSQGKTLFVVAGATSERRGATVKMIDSCLWIDPKTIGFPFVSVFPDKVLIEFKNAYGSFTSSTFKTVEVVRSSTSSNTVTLV
jgi:3',5'-cyclic AMP phosphodiesterase CpdA